MATAHSKGSGGRPAATAVAVATVQAPIYPVERLNCIQQSLQAAQALQLTFISIVHTINQHIIHDIGWDCIVPTPFHSHIPFTRLLRLSVGRIKGINRIGASLKRPNIDLPTQDSASSTEIGTQPGGDRQTFINGRGGIVQSKIAKLPIHKQGIVVQQFTAAYLIGHTTINLSIVIMMIPVISNTVERGLTVGKRTIFYGQLIIGKMSKNSPTPIRCAVAIKNTVPYFKGSIGIKCTTIYGRMVIHKY